MFYNVENLFDTMDDSLKNDNEFLPSSDRHWTYKRMNKKINNVYKTIMAVGGWQPPEIIGLCEVENFFVLNGLVNYTPFSKFQYQIIHQNSPDNRGIDVAMVYNPKSFRVINNIFFEIKNPEFPDSKTRDILYAKGIINKKDTLHVFVNHWPSRWGGEKASEPKRLFIASFLKTKVDSIFAENPGANIIVMGDFNDNPDNRSIGIIASQDSQYYLMNLANNLNKESKGTCKYRGQWSFFDQFMVSGNLFEGKSQIQCKKMFIADFEFLLEEDIRYTGKKPKRTYVGYKYNGGFSDHLPVYIDIYKIY